MMAWCRAKGELEAILHTFWVAEEGYDDLEPRFKKFIEEIESESALA
jgi:hypothetical protein